MRTIDPFFAPGLWGGLPKPPQSSMVTAGRLTGPLQRPAVTAEPGLAQSLAQAPLASLTGSVLGRRFHAWYGRSKRRTICSVFPVREAEPAKGLPDFAEGIVIAATRACGQLQALAVFVLGEGDERSARADEAVFAGASEWHVHLLAASETEREAVLRDLTGG